MLRWEGARKQRRSGSASRIEYQKEIVIEIAALKGKGYPAPVDLDTGSWENESCVGLRAKAGNRTVVCRDQRGESY